VAFRSSVELTLDLQRPAAADHEHERRTVKADLNWAGWYAEYISAEQAGKQLLS
jgi:hypothetical protein